ncbi:histidine kinase [Micromonospora sp. M12]
MTAMRWCGRWRRPEVAADAALALALLGFGLLATGLAGDNQPGSRPVDSASRVLIAVAALALLIRRRAPSPSSPWSPWPPRRTWCSATRTDRSCSPSWSRCTRWRCGCRCAGGVRCRWRVRPVVDARLLVPWPGTGLGGSAARVGLGGRTVRRGVVVRVSRETAARTRAEQARTRAEQARRQADEERLRIAQEVHDVVGHGLAAISMQAEIALHLLPKRPEQAEVALTAISRTSREALDELRVTLGAVRRGAEREPVPGLARLPALRERLAGAGLAVEVHVVGAPGSCRPRWIWPRTGWCRRR